MLNRLKSLIGFGRNEVEWYEEDPPNYGMAVAVGWLAFRIGHSVSFNKTWQCTYPFIFKSTI
jgi:hypothetical protein